MNVRRKNIESLRRLLLDLRTLSNNSEIKALINKITRKFMMSVPNRSVVQFREDENCSVSGQLLYYHESTRYIFVNGYLYL
jgi:hypothetical protein